MGVAPEKKYREGIRNVIGVVSGKGGVGKSTVAVLLAQALAAQSCKVGILDADITGPSIPRLLALQGKKAGTDGKSIMPIENEEGIKLMSINLLTEDEDAPVIWRGPMLGSALSQFWTDCQWGELDFLIIDFPPSTSDVALTAYQMIPMSGVIIVATPQDYVSMIVRKSVRMAETLKTPVLGVVENMATMICPKCGEAVSLFDDGRGHSDERLGLPLIVSLPWRKEVVMAASLRWADLPQAVKDDAKKIAAAACRASAPYASGPGSDGTSCECGKQSCCDSCGEAKTKA